MRKQSLGAPSGRTPDSYDYKGASASTDNAIGADIVTSSGTEPNGKRTLGTPVVLPR